MSAGKSSAERFWQYRPVCTIDVAGGGCTCSLCVLRYYLGIILITSEADKGTAKIARQLGIDYAEAVVRYVSIRLNYKRLTSFILIDGL